MSAAPRTHRFSVADYHRMAASGVLSPEARVELIDGEIVDVTPIGPKHFSVVTRLTGMLYERCKTQAIVASQNPVRLDPHSEPEPDISVLHYRTDFYASALPTAADVHLLIEVCDTTKAQEIARKLDKYAESAIPEVWVVDLNGDRVEVYTLPGDSAYASQRIFRRGSRIEASTLTGVELRIDEILG